MDRAPGAACCRWRQVPLPTRFVRRRLHLAAPLVSAALPTAPLLPGQSPPSLQESTPPVPRLLEQERHLLRLPSWPVHPPPPHPHWLQPAPHTLPATAARSDSPSASSKEPRKWDKDSTIRHRIPTMAILPNPRLRCPSKPAT